MIVLAAVMTEAAKHPTWLPPVAFPIIAFCIFLTLGVITWTFRDVSNRHSYKAATSHHDDHEHGSAGPHH